MNIDKKYNPLNSLRPLPEALRESAMKFYQLPLASREELVSSVNAYSDVIADAARSRGDLDVNLASCIARSCLALLAEHWGNASDHQRRLVQCACYYFVDDEDEDGDLESVYGFDDDAELLNVVVEQFDRPDLAIHV